MGDSQQPHINYGCLLLAVGLAGEVAATLKGVELGQGQPSSKV